MPLRVKLRAAVPVAVFVLPACSIEPASSPTLLEPELESLPDIGASALTMVS